MDPKEIILSSLSSRPVTLANIRDTNPDISLDDFQTAAWYLVDNHLVNLDKDFKLSLVA